MSVQDYSTTPGNNNNVGGINIAENCPAGNLNGAMRQIMADIKLFANSIPVAGTSMPIAGGTFTGNITRQGAGAYVYNAEAGATSGRLITVQQGSALPALAEGDKVFEWA